MSALAVAGEIVMVLKTLLFEIKQGPSHCKGGGGFLAVVGEIVKVPE